MGSGWWISPMTLMSIGSIPFFLKKDRFEMKSADLFLLLFFVWSFLSFFRLPNFNSLLGLFQFGELIVVYFIFRFSFAKKNLGYIAILLLTFLFYQSIISLYQIIASRPLGLIGEPLLSGGIHSLVTLEGADLYRVTGTFGHPNVLASTIIALSPFLYSISVSFLPLNVFK